MMKKYFTLLLMLAMAYSYAQLKVTAIKVSDETCPGSGALSWTVSGQSGGTITYSVEDVTNAASPVTKATLSDTSYSGLPGGDTYNTARQYRIVATETIGSVTNVARSANVAIVNQKVTLSYTVTKNSNEICGNDGQLQ